MAVEIQRVPWRPGDTVQMGHGGGWHKAAKPSANQFWKFSGTTGLWAPHTLVAGDIPQLAHSSLSGLTTGDDHTQYLKEADFDDINFLVGTATGHTGAEIVVGTTPGGELGGTWASPTVDATHSGTSHAGVIATHEAAVDPHTGYLKESDLVYAGYTPTVTQGGAVTSFSVNSARYLQIGKKVHVTGQLHVNNAGTAAGANVITISLPVTWANQGGVHAAGTAFLYDLSADTLYPASVRLAAGATTTFTLLPVDQVMTSYGAGGLALGTLRFTAALAAGDLLGFDVHYEAA